MAGLVVRVGASTGSPDAPSLAALVLVPGRASGVLAGGAEDVELRAKSERLWEDFLNNEAIFPFQPVLIHYDLACEHVLCDPERSVLTGVIDWGDATIGDPAMDFVGLHNCRGREFTERVLARYQGTIDAAFWQRMDFYLCYGPFSELLYGAYSENEKIIAKGIEGLRAMFRE